MGKYFGTDGVRGNANTVLTSAIAYRIGRYIGQYNRASINKILIGRDTRLSGDMLASSLIAGICASGGIAYDLGVTTTPSISYLVENHDFTFGVMISASHNPFYDNGIKIFASNGEKCPNSIELEIESYIDSPSDNLPFVSNENVGRIIDARSYLKEYLDYMANKKEGDYSSLKVLVDCANGSASMFAKHFFKDLVKLNADFINYEFTGININDNCGSTHIGQLSRLVKEGGYTCGLAFDGDADRLLIVDKEGNLVDGDAIMYMNALDMREKGKLNNDTLVLTVMSNLGLKKALIAQGVKYEEVGVGDKYVQACLRDHKLSLGGEQSGHIIFNDELNTGDGFLTAVHCLNIFAKAKGDIASLLKGFKVFPQLLKNIVVTNKDAIMSHAGLKEKIAEAEKALEGNGRILVRPSGTEQLIRVMAEASDDETCEKLVNLIIDYISEISF